MKHNKKKETPSKCVTQDEVMARKRKRHINFTSCMLRYNDHEKWHTKLQLCKSINIAFGENSKNKGTQSAQKRFEKMGNCFRLNVVCN